MIREMTIIIIFAKINTLRNVCTMTEPHSYFLFLEILFTYQETNLTLRRYGAPDENNHMTIRWATRWPRSVILASRSTITLAMSKDTLEYSHTLRVSPLSSPNHSSHYIRGMMPCRRVVRNQSVLGVTEKEKEEEQQSSSPTKERLSIEHEIECPALSRSHDAAITI
jgi:hypothetical protein